MARLTKHVLGIPSGSIGDAVCFSTWRGKACIRSTASSVYNPNTPTQVSNRMKFALLGKLTRPLAQVLMSGFKAAGKYGSKAMTPLNAFVQYNFNKDDTFKGQGPDEWEVDYSKLAVAQGGLVGFSSQNISIDPSNNVTFTWESDETAEGTDEVYCVLYNEALNLGKYVTAERSAGTATTTIKDTWLNAGPTHCYIFAYDGKKGSSSIYLDSIE